MKSNIRAIGESELLMNLVLSDDPICWINQATMPSPFFSSFFSPDLDSPVFVFEVAGTGRYFNFRLETNCEGQLY